jgi:RNA polymerase sigma factor (sigma-70 family)
MDMIPRNDYGERCQFDAYCKLVLYHEAIDYLREMQRRRDRELSFSDLPQMEMDKLCVVDHYPSDRFTFSSHGYDLHIENELVADAFAGLSVQEQSILILHFVLDLPDQEVGHLVGMSRSAVQRRRAKSLTELRIKLAALMPKGEVEGMKKPTYKGKELLPLSVIDAARDGDSQAVDQVLRYYEGYINKLCTRTLYEPDGQPHVRVDEYMKRRLEIKLIHSIVSMS